MQNQTGVSGKGAAFQGVILVALLTLLTPLAAPSQAAAQDPTLQNSLKRAIAGFRGNVGVYVRHLSSGRIATVNADSVFPTASMIKIPILLETFDRIERGELSYDQKLVYADSLLYAGEDILGSFKSGEELLLSKAVF